MKTSEKAKYFNDFFANNKDKIDDGGIIFDNPNTGLFTVGAYVSDKGFGNKGTAVDQQTGEDKLKDFRRQFASQVFKMGSIDATDSTNYDILDKLYRDNIVESTVQEQVDWTKNAYIPDYVSELKLSEAFGKFIFNTDETKDIKITSSGIEIDGKLIDATIDEKKAKGDYSLYALIVTKGKVNIEGPVDFRGCIIAKGDINIDGDGDKNIVHDRDAVSKIKAKYAEVSDVNSIFKGTPNPGSGTKTTVGTKISSGTIQNEPYDAATYLQKGFWRLEK
jgi:hypothetical protein